MSSAETKKFLFDTDFEEIIIEEEIAEEASADEAKAAADAEENAEEVIEEVEEIVIPTFSEEEVQKAREDGIAHGRDEALKDLEGSLQKKMSETMQVLEQKLVNIADEQLADKEERARSAAAVAAVIVRKMFPAMNMEKSMDEINHMITQSLERTSGEAKISFYVAEELATAVEQKVTEITSLSGRDIEFKVIGSADIKFGDCRIEWSGGGLVRDQAQMWQEIDEIVERNLGGITLAQSTPDEPADQPNEPTSDEDQAEDENP